MVRSLGSSSSARRVLCAPWCPWAAADRSGVLVRVDAIADLLGGGIGAWVGDRGVIVLSPSLDPVERRVALAHELIHLERGGGIDRPDMPATWLAEVAREEAAVDAEVARRLVPRRALLDLDRSSGLGAPEVAERFEVTLELAERAMRQALARSAAVGDPALSGADPWRGGRCWHASSDR